VLATVTTGDYVQKNYLFKLQKFTGTFVKLLKNNFDVNGDPTSERQALLQGMTAMEHCKIM